MHLILLKSFALFYLAHCYIIRSAKQSLNLHENVFLLLCVYFQWKMNALGDLLVRKGF